MEGYAPRPAGQSTSILFELKHARSFLRNLPFWFQDYLQLGVSGMLLRIGQKIRLARKQRIRLMDREVEIDIRDFVEDDVSQIPEVQIRIMESQIRALWRYSPSPYDGRVTLLRARGQSLLRSPDFERGWGQLAKNGVDVRIIAGSHRTILEQPHVQTLSEQLGQCIKKALTSGQEGNTDH